MSQKSFIITIIIVLIAIIVIMVPEEPLQETEIDVKSKCRILLKSMENIPEETVIYCKNLLRDEHET